MQAFDEGVAVHARHFNIHQEQIIGFQFGFGQRMLAIRRFFSGKP